MKYKGIVKGSRTYDLAAFLAAFGAIQQNLPEIRVMLGDYYGLVFMGVAVVVAVLRKLTTGPVGQKK